MAKESAREFSVFVLWEVESFSLRNSPSRNFKPWWPVLVFERQPRERSICRIFRLMMRSCIDKLIEMFTKRTSPWLPPTFIDLLPPLDLFSVQDYDVKMPYFEFYGGRKQEAMKFYCIF
ncbi:unnamed protein product [Porites lobata]|uniref:Uncharacterized protein n=1 Tax=Porites lobata TaxID=104759 RepID=A0ABN8REK2_9CNID|nr:unnamed protein product [Porites lobata]